MKITEFKEQEFDSLKHPHLLAYFSQGYWFRVNFPAPQASFLNLFLSFLTYNILLFAYNIILMSLEQFKEQNIPEDAHFPFLEGLFSANHHVLNDSRPSLPQFSFSTIIQQKTPQQIPKQRRNIKLEAKSEPSEEKMRRINERKDGYKRSTNNSHKKFICVAKRLLVRFLGGQMRHKFEYGFDAFKNSRTYYFIVLAHAKLLLSPAAMRSFRKQFTGLMQSKIDYYRKEVNRTDNFNFAKFRCDEIADIEFALNALDLYFQGRVEEAVEAIYKRDRAEVLKKQQFEQAIQTVREVQALLKGDNISHNQVQDVIILQHNASLQAVQDENSTILHPEYTRIAQSAPFSLGISQQSSLNRSEQLQHEVNEEMAMPLLFLEASYPYFPYFSEIMFPYEPQMQYYQCNPINFLYPSYIPESNQQKIFDMKHQIHANAETSDKNMTENGKKQFVSVRKTGVEDDDE